MLVRKAKLQIFLLTAICLLMCGGLFYAAWSQAQNSAAGDACIRCHVTEFNQGTASAVQHPPFWDRQCTACHVSAGSTWQKSSVTSVSTPITGTPVDQFPLWRKQQVYGGEAPGLQQQVTLTGLQTNMIYRFRVLVAEKRSEPLEKSLWLGLNTGEFLSAAGHQDIRVSEGLGDSIDNHIETLLINIVSADTAVISWDVVQPLYSWLELQELSEQESGTAAVTGTSNRDSHPPLRDSIEQAIDVCYQCHPESTLGASHPVRLYGGQDVRIPEELPTVDGMLTCVTCHNPHGAAGKMLIREVIKTQLCVTCHYKYKNSSPSTMFR